MTGDPLLDSLIAILGMFAFCWATGPAVEWLGEKCTDLYFRALEQSKDSQ